MTELSVLVNPFRETVVQDAWQSLVDIGEIHAHAFEACRAGIASAARGVPDSLLVYGAAGSGKTHLLARLQRHLAEAARSAPDRVLACVFSFVRLQTSPQLLWQHVRRRLASDLMRRDQGLTQLQRLVAHQIGAATGRSPRAVVMELRVLGNEDHQTIAQHLGDVANRLGLSRDLCIILEHLVCNRNVRDASAWLSGDSLPETVLAGLGLGVDPEEDREQTAREIVTALCRLAGDTLPIVFCFDQVESLQRTANDAEALFRFGRMAADLCDADANVFTITCLQVAFLDQFKHAVRSADYDRMARRSVLLEQLTREHVEKLVRSRLDLIPELKELRVARPGEPFFPLSTKLVHDLALEQPCVARRVLALAARAFEAAQRGTPAAVPTTAEYLAGELQARQKERLAALQPSDTDRIVLQGVQVIAELEQAEIADSDPLKADVVLRGARHAAISVRNEADGRRLSPKLKALLSSTPRPDGARLVIVRDPRLPISKAATKAREHLAELERRGATLLGPSVEALAALDALSSLLGDAKSGDLANDGEALEANMVLGWLRSLRKDLDLEPVSELVEAIFGEPKPSPSNDEQDLFDLLSHEHVLEVEMAAKILERPPERVLELARKASARCVVLDGPPAVLLDMAGIASEGERVAEAEEAS